MLKIVIKKPMELTIISADPINFGGAFFATMVEKRGESAITTIPQKRRKVINKLALLRSKIHGEIRQQQHDKSRAINAVRFVPSFGDIYPPSTQAKPPMPIIKNDKTEILNVV